MRHLKLELQNWRVMRFGERSSPRAAAITFWQTLGTALGDWIADTGGLGYEGGALVFAAGLAVTAALYYWTEVSRCCLGCLHSDTTAWGHAGRFS